MPKYNVLDKNGTVILELEAESAEKAKEMTEKFKIEGAVKVEERPSDS